MKWNKRMVFTLIVFCAMILIAGIKCAATRPEPVSTTTYVVDADGGNIVVTEEKNDFTAGKLLDIKSYVLVLAGCGVIFAMAGNFRRRVKRLSKMKSRCTVTVPAVVSNVISSRNDGHIRYKVKVYNATYQYEYLGLPYESNNQCYGARRKTLTGKVNVGDSEKIYVNPENPQDIFDSLAEDSLSSAKFISIVLIASGFFIYSGIFLR